MVPVPITSSIAANASYSPDVQALAIQYETLLLHVQTTLKARSKCCPCILLINCSIAEF